MPDDQTSQTGATGGGSQTGSDKVYTQAELDQHVSALQSSLQKQINAKADEAKGYMEQLEEAQAELESLKQGSKSSGGATSGDDTKPSATVAQIRERREAEKKAAEAAARETSLRKRELALEHGVKAEDIEGDTPADAEISALRLALKTKGGTTAPSGVGKQVTDRGKTAASGTSFSFRDLAESVRSKK